MTTSKASLNHLERTATEPRDKVLSLIRPSHAFHSNHLQAPHAVKIIHVTRINLHTRLFRLQPVSSDPPIIFLPGQWLDVHIPGIHKAGGFTITSTPSALLSSPPYLELAIQKSPQNQHAAWLWQDESQILGKEVSVRVGGSFVWPPLGRPRPERVVFVAGGVGINPLVSMATAIADEMKVDEMRREKLGMEVRFLYSTKISEASKEGDSEVVEEILFLPRLLEIQRCLGSEGEMSLFLTSSQGDSNLQRCGVLKLLLQREKVKVTQRRINEQDLMDVLGPVEKRSQTVCYICGVPSMTDEFVERVKKAEGMVESNVLFEKWW